MTIGILLRGVTYFFLVYLFIYASYLFLSVSMGAWRLYKRDLMVQVKNELKHDFYFPISILVPAYNEEVTILDSIKSLMNLDYKLYEIIVIDDGSKDNTSKVLIEHFKMQKVNRPIKNILESQEMEFIFEAPDSKVRFTLIRKKNGGKGDALNMGINVSLYPYFCCIDADSMLQKDSLERIAQPALEDDDIVAVGGLIRVSQCIELSDGNVLGYHIPWNPIISMQVMEYDRSFLASRILLDSFNGNLIISGAFGLFKKDLVIATGGYDTNTIGEDMELVMKLHVFCRNNKIPYSIRYEPNAVCWSQAPESLRDLAKQRRRWHIGLLQSLMKYRKIILRSRFGLVGSISYLYYLFYELFSPVVEVFGLFIALIAGLAGLLNVPFMIKIYLLYALYGTILTMTTFFQRIYTQNLKISINDTIKAIANSFLENTFFRFFYSFVRFGALIKYRKNKHGWGHVKRIKQEEVL